jgi:hypothetical protein
VRLDVKAFVGENMPNILKEEVLNILAKKDDMTTEDIARLFRLFIQKDDNAKFMKGFREMEAIFGEPDEDDMFNWTQFKMEMTEDIEFYKKLSKIIQENPDVKIPPHIESLDDLKGLKLLKEDKTDKKAKKKKSKKKIADDNAWEDVERDEDSEEVEDDSYEYIDEDSSDDELDDSSDSDSDSDSESEEDINEDEEEDDDMEAFNDFDDEEKEDEYGEDYYDKMYMNEEKAPRYYYDDDEDRGNYESEEASFTMEDDEGRVWSGQIIDTDITQKTLPGNRMLSHRCLVVIGDGRGTAGYGMGKGFGAPEALRNAYR